MGSDGVSLQRRSKRLSIRDIRGRKGGDPLVCLTAYSAAMARLLDPHVDLILVGDSLGMVLYGAPNTLSVTLDQMIAHGAAVAGVAAWVSRPDGGSCTPSDSLDAASRPSRSISATPPRVWSACPSSVRTVCASWPPE